MAVLCVKLIEATTGESFQTALRVFIRQLEFPPVDLASIRIEMAVIPGQHYAGLVTWFDVEDDLLNAPALSRSETGVS